MYEGYGSSARTAVVRFLRETLVSKRMLRFLPCLASRRAWIMGIVSETHLDSPARVPFVPSGAGTLACSRCALSRTS